MIKKIDSEQYMEKFWKQFGTKLVVHFSNICLFIFFVLKISNIMFDFVDHLNLIITFSG